MPQTDLVKVGLALWQHDVWFKLIEASQSDKPRMVDLSYHPAMQLPAISRYTATSPNLLRWFKHHNEGKSYNEQVKPFGFLTGLMADSLDCEARMISGASKRSASNSGLKPISPYETDPAIAAQKAFDRITGKRVPIGKLKSFAQAIGRYHLQPENKFLNGDYVDSGKTRRRHVFATCTSHIGKEANELEKQASIGFDPDAQPSYGYGPHDIAKLQSELARLCDVFSPYEIALHGRMKSKRLADFIDADSSSHRAAIGVEAMEGLVRHFGKRENAERAELDALDQLVSECGLRKTARKMGVDPSNLRRTLARRKAMFG